MILVGKDGGSKLDTSEPLEPAMLFERIDSSLSAYESV